MKDLLAQMHDLLLIRHHGPLSFRIIIQPVVASIFAIRAGLADARAGRPAYGWTVLTRGDSRRRLLLEGWSHVNRLFLAAIGIDIIYQVIEFRWIYPIQALIVAAILAFPSYFLVRGLTNRIVRRCTRNSGFPSSHP